MAKFPIAEARQELGFIPSAGVRANIDTRLGAGAGAAIGQALIETLTEAKKRTEAETEKREAIAVKRQQMQDANSAVIADTLRRTADAEFETFKLKNPQEIWETERIRQTQEVGNAVAELAFSPDSVIAQQIKSEAYTAIETAQALTDATRQLRTDTIDAQTEAMVNAFRTGGAKEQLEAITRFRDSGPNMGKDRAEVVSDIKAARDAGKKLRKQDTIDAWQDRIAENPTLTEQILEGELSARKGAGFDPSGTGFDIATSKASGAVPDEAGHLGSIDPRTGMVLKGMRHETIDKTFSTEKNLGNKIIFKGGRFFSVSQSDTGKGLTLAEAKKIKTVPVEGGGAIPENELPSSDIQSLINLATARKVQLLADTQAEVAAARRIAEKELQDGITDGTVSVTDIQKDPRLDAAAVRRLQQDMKTKAELDVNKGWPLVDDLDIIRSLDSELAKMEAGSVDTVEMYQKIDNAMANGQLTRESYSRYRGLARKGGRDAIQLATDTSMELIDNALIRRFSDREARTILRSIDRELTAQEKREASSNAFLLQVNRHQSLLIRNDIEQKLRSLKKETVSGIEATTEAAKVWEMFRRKTLGDKINDFKVFSGQRVPMPDGFPKNVWDNASDRAKANFVTGAAAGFSNKEMIEAQTK